MGPALQSDPDRVARCRLKAEEYRTVAESARNPSARAVLVKLAATCDEMADQAQARIDARRTIPGGPTP